MERIVTIFFCLIISSSQLFTQIKAFPCADGFGKFATGGRGGRVIEVTNLNDDGPGSLRAALSEDGKRIIIFKVSGYISLKSELKVTKGNVTIAGQSAPGDGICIRDNKFEVQADNVIIRYLRFRLGDETKLETDAFGVNNSKNVIVDHCSMSWGIDEVASMYNNEDFTLQYCIISESLDNSYHSKGAHGYGGIWGGKRASFHHNLLAHHTSRNPRFQGARTTKNPSDEQVDFRNNVIFNWGFNSAYAGEMGRYNIVSNYFKPGPATICKDRIVEIFDDESRWFIEGNYIEGFPEISSNNWDGGVQGKVSEKSRVNHPFPFIIDTTDSPQEAFKKVLKYSGAIYPIRDAVDLRIVNEVETGIPNFEGKYYRSEHKNLNHSIKLGIIDSQIDVGGWPELKTSEPLVDTDHDGMPDEWELANKLDPKDSSDASKISKNGYSNIENYLNELVIEKENQYEKK